MKIKFIGQSDLTSKGLQFIPGFEYDVSEEVYKYLKSTFNNVELIEVPTMKKDSEAKPKVNTKIIPKGE